MWKGCGVATRPAIPQIGWDTVVVIDFLDQTAERYPFILPIAKAAEAGKAVIVVSTLAITETIYLDPQAVASVADQEKMISDFFDRPFVHREAASLFICEIARDIRRIHSVAGADAIHLATMVHTNTPFFLTNDGEKKRKKNPLLPLDNKIKLANGSMLRIMTPEAYEMTQSPLFNSANTNSPI
jgi:predicted nucleic acid-binding protein